MTEVWSRLYEVQLQHAPATPTVVPPLSSTTDSGPSQIIPDVYAILPWLQGYCIRIISVHGTATSVLLRMKIKGYVPNKDSLESTAPPHSPEQSFR